MGTASKTVGRGWEAAEVQEIELQLRAGRQRENQMKGEGG